MEIEGKNMVINSYTSRYKLNVPRSHVQDEKSILIPLSMVRLLLNKSTYLKVSIMSGVDHANVVAEV